MQTEAGKRSAATKPVFGFDAVMKLHEHLATVFDKSKFIRSAFINGLPGFITLEADGELQTTALEIEDEKVAAIYVMRNPDKLRHLHESAHTMTVDATNHRASRYQRLHPDRITRRNPSMNG